MLLLGVESLGCDAESPSAETSCDMGVDCDRRREGRVRRFEHSGWEVENRKATVRSHDSGSYCSVGCLLGECFAVSKSFSGAWLRSKERHELVNYGSLSGVCKLSRVLSLLGF